MLATTALIGTCLIATGSASSGYFSTMDLPGTYSAVITPAPYSSNVPMISYDDMPPHLYPPREWQIATGSIDWPHVTPIPAPIQFPTLPLGAILAAGLPGGVALDLALTGTWWGLDVEANREQVGLGLRAGGKLFAAVGGQTAWGRWAPGPWLGVGLRF